MEMQVKARTASLISAIQTCVRQWQRQNDMTSAHKHNKIMKRTRTTLQGTNPSVPQVGTNNQLGVCHRHIQLKLHEELPVICAIVQSFPVILYTVQKSIWLLKISYISTFGSLLGFDCTSEFKDMSFKSERSPSSWCIIKSRPINLKILQ